MLETAILVMIGAGSLFMLTQFKREANQAQPDQAWQNMPIISHGGMYALSRPADSPRLTAYRDFQITPSGFVLYDHLSGQVLALNFAEIQWVSAITAPSAGITQLMIHIEINTYWRILTLQMPQRDMLLLARFLQGNVSSARSHLGQTITHPHRPLSVRVADENLQGDLALGAEVQLYLLPHVLVVMQEDRVQAKLDMSSIRRVLAVERMSSRLEQLLPSNKPEGLVRLYSLYESVAFALSAYRELAQEISFLARCPIDFVTQEEKHKS